MTTVAEARAWDGALDALIGRLGARSYIAGLLAPLERKNGWHLAEAAGDASPDSVQDFLARMRWDADAVRDDLRAYVVEHLGDPQAVLVLDETGFVKKGLRSVGVQRQYSGTAGRIENCQIGVFLGYAARHGHALIDRALYLPQSWAGDEGRRRLAWVPCAWVAADSVYGADRALRQARVRRRIGYVLAVTSGQRLFPGTVRDWVEEVPADGWHRHITLAMLALAFLTVVRTAAIGGRGPGRLGRRTSALDRAGGPPPAPPAACPFATRAPHRYRVVALAKTPPAAGAALSLETPHPNR